MVLLIVTALNTAVDKLRFQLLQECSHSGTEVKQATKVARACKEGLSDCFGFS